MPVFNIPMLPSSSPDYKKELQNHKKIVVYITFMLQAFS
jgi:hypothetical protein